LNLRGTSLISQIRTNRPFKLSNYENNQNLTPSHPFLPQTFKKNIENNQRIQRLNIKSPNYRFNHLKSPNEINKIDLLSN